MPTSAKPSPETLHALATDAGMGIGDLPPNCGHSACSQHYIDTGSGACVDLVGVVQRAALRKDLTATLEGYESDYGRQVLIDSDEDGDEYATQLDLAEVVDLLCDVSEICRAHGLAGIAEWMISEDPTQGDRGDRTDYAEVLLDWSRAAGDDDVMPDPWVGGWACSSQPPTFDNVAYLHEQCAPLTARQREHVGDNLIGALCAPRLACDRRSYHERTKAAIDAAVKAAVETHPDEGHALAQVAGDLGALDLRGAVR